MYRFTPSKLRIRLLKDGLDSLQDERYKSTLITGLALINETDYNILEETAVARIRFSQRYMRGVRII